MPRARLTPESRLDLVLRSRPATVGELASLTEFDPADPGALQELLDQLMASGLVSVHDDLLAYREPHELAGERLAGLLAETTAALARAQDGLTELSRSYPVLAARTSRPAPPEGGLVSHGPGAVREDFLRRRDRGLSSRQDAVLPDLSLLDVDDFLATAVAHADAEGITLGMIVRTSDAADPVLRAQVLRLVDAGVVVRSLPEPPSWFGVSSTDAGLPATWGESWPSSIVTLEHPAMVALVGALFDVLWAAAQPVVPDEQGWEPLLRLLAKGATVDTASRALGIAPRTGRRRVAEAMAHHGCSTMFELGAAHARRHAD